MNAIDPDFILARDENWSTTGYREVHLFIGSFVHRCTLYIETNEPMN